MTRAQLAALRARAEELGGVGDGALYNNERPWCIVGIMKDVGIVPAYVVPALIDSEWQAHIRLPSIHDVDAIIHRIGGKIKLRAPVDQVFAALDPYFILED